jgi:hypothetical protein
MEITVRDKKTGVFSAKNILHEYLENESRCCPAWNPPVSLRLPRPEGI